MTDSEKKQLEKEITGLKAKLNWTHISETLKDVYRLRLAELATKLQNKNTDQ